MKVKYFVNIENGFYSQFNQRNGGNYREKAPNLLGEYVEFPANYHEVGSVFELDLKSLTIIQLKDLRDLEYHQSLVRLDNNYNKNFTTKETKGKYDLNIPTSQSLSEIVEFYNQFSTKEQKEEFIKQTKPVDKKK